MAKVSIIMGSKSDFTVAEKAIKVLHKFGVGFEIAVASAHRTPHRVEEIVKNIDADVFISIAGLSAALPGVIASFTCKPVIGVPVSGALNYDALLSMVQMPPESRLPPSEWTAETMRPHSQSKCWQFPTLSF